MSWPAAATAAAAGAVLATAAAAVTPRWILPEWPPDKVQSLKMGRRVGAARADHVHAGVDLGPPKMAGMVGRALGATVVAPLPGIVTKIGGWRPGSRRVEYRTAWGLVVIGAIAPSVRVGQVVRAGQEIATLAAYPNGSTMAHVELWVWRRGRWELGEPQPIGLLDAARLVRAGAVTAKLLGKLRPG